MNGENKEVKMGDDTMSTREGERQREGRAGQGCYVMLCSVLFCSVLVGTRDKSEEERHHHHQTTTYKQAKRIQTYR
jgi:hypothetical protein